MKPAFLFEATCVKGRAGASTLGMQLTGGSEMSEEEKKRLPLSEMINYVAEEIKKADASARSKPGRKVMRFAECEVEVAFELELEVGGKVNLWAVELGTKGVQTATHTLKVKYHAIGDNPMEALNEITRDFDGGGFVASVPPV